MGESDSLGAKNYFDLLSDELVEHVARQFSARPRSANWASFITTTDAELLLCRQTALRSVALKVSRHVSISRNSYNKESNHLLLTTTNEKILKTIVQNGASTMKEVCIYMDCFDAQRLHNSSRNVMRRLLSTGGPLFPAALSIATQAADGYSGRIAIAAASIAVPFLSSILSPSRTWLDVVADDCTMLERLELTDSIGTEQFSSLISKRGHNLRTLKLHLYKVERYLAPVTRSCSRLVYLSVSNLSESLESFWIAVGRSVKKLRLRFTQRADAVEVLKTVQNHCRLLTDVDAQPAVLCVDTYDVLSAIAELYSSYRENLSYANLQNMHRGGCMRVVQSCPNMKCSGGYMLLHAPENAMSIRDARLFVDQLVILNDRVTDLDVIGLLPRSFAFPRELLCTNLDLQRVKCVGLGAEAMGLFRFLFQKNQFNLRHFVWETDPCLCSSKPDLKDLIKILADKTGELRNICICADVRELGMFLGLARRNPLLKSVNIKFSKHYQRNGLFRLIEIVVADIIETFEKCSNLSELVISFEDELWAPYKLRQRYDKIARLCIPLRNRGIFLRVGPVLYLP